MHFEWGKLHFLVHHLKLYHQINLLCTHLRRQCEIQVHLKLNFSHQLALEISDHCLYDLVWCAQPSVRRTLTLLSEDLILFLILRG